MDIWLHPERLRNGCRIAAHPEGVILPLITCGIIQGGGEVGAEVAVPDGSSSGFDLSPPCPRRPTGECFKSDGHHYSENLGFYLVSRVSGYEGRTWSAAAAVEEWDVTRTGEGHLSNGLEPVPALLSASRRH